MNENHQYYYQMQQQLFCAERKWVDFVASDGYAVPYLPVYNAQFFPTEKAPKIEMRIIHRILCFRLASLISL